MTGAMDAWCKPGPSKGKEKETDAVAKADSAKSKLLVVVGCVPSIAQFLERTADDRADRTYSIGKERIVKAIAKTLNAKVFCDARKRAILQCQADPELHAMLSSNPKTALVHVVPLQHISVERMEEYLEKMGGAFGRILAFRPTGWTCVRRRSVPTRADAAVQVHAAVGHGPRARDRHAACARPHAPLHGGLAQARARLERAHHAVRRAVLGALVLLRAHRVRAFVRLGQDDRDGQRGQRDEPREDAQVVREVERGAQGARRAGRARRRAVPRPRLLVISAFSFSVFQ